MSAAQKLHLKKEWNRFLVPFVSGVLFALGLGWGGMTDRAYVQGFLDIFGNWKPHLIMVMGGSVVIYSIAFFFFAKKRSRPLMAPKFWLPEKTEVTARLVVGSMLFGAGWGLGGYCPGPGVVSLVTLNRDPLIFVAAMVVGMLLVPVWERFQLQRQARG